MPARTYVFVPLVITSVALFAGATYLTTAMHARPGSTQPEVPDPAPVAECVARLSQVGITPQSLAAAGASTETANAVLAGALAHLTRERRESLRALDAQLSAVAKRPSTGNLGELKQTKATAMAELFAFAALPLSGEQRQAVEQLHANRHWPVPMEYKTLSLTEAEWIGLRDELSAARGRAEPHSISHSDDIAVIGARNGLDHLADIKQAWNAAMQP